MQQLVPLTPIPDSDRANDDSMDFLGPMLANDVATAIAEGDMDPITMERFPVVAASTCSNNINNSCGGGQPIGARGNTLNTGAPSFSFRPSSFQGVRQAASAAFQQPVTRMPSHSIAAAPPGSRRFPSSFGQRAEPSTSLFGTMNTKASSTVASSSSSSSTTLRSSESSPPVVSRFFAAQPKRTSPLDEIEKSLDAMPASSSSFESQDPLEVNVARSISFSPVEEKKHAHATTSENKENHTPIFSASRESVPPPAKENAFSRMMRAGSLLQKQSLKRKAAASSSTSSRHGKQKPGGMFAHQQQQQRSAEQRLQQYARDAASNNTNQEKSDVMKDHVVRCVVDTTLSSQYVAAEPEVEQDATEDVESQSNSSISVVVARGSCLSGAHQSSYATKVECADEDNQQSHFKKVASGSKPPTSSSVLASLDRFRFKK